MGFAYKDIEKEFEELYKTSEEILRPLNQKEIKVFLKAKINQVIDDMIGEWRDKDWEQRKKEWMDIGYNQKVQELKEYKKKFNI